MYDGGWGEEIVSDSVDGEDDSDEDDSDGDDSDGDDSDGDDSDGDDSDGDDSDGGGGSSGGPKGSGGGDHMEVLDDIYHDDIKGNPIEELPLDFEDAQEQDINDNDTEIEESMVDDIVVNKEAQVSVATMIRNSIDLEVGDFDLEVGDFENVLFYLGEYDVNDVLSVFREDLELNKTVWTKAITFKNKSLETKKLLFVAYLERLTNNRYPGKSLDSLDGNNIKEIWEFLFKMTKDDILALDLLSKDLKIWDNPVITDKMRSKLWDVLLKRNRIDILLTDKFLEAKYISRGQKRDLWYKLLNDDNQIERILKDKRLHEVGFLKKKDHKKLLQRVLELEESLSMSLLEDSEYKKTYKDMHMTNTLIKYFNVFPDYQTDKQIEPMMKMPHFAIHLLLKLDDFKGKNLIRENTFTSDVVDKNVLLSDYILEKAIENLHIREELLEDKDEKEQIELIIRTLFDNLFKQYSDALDDESKGSSDAQFIAEVISYIPEEKQIEVVETIMKAYKQTRDTNIQASCINAIVKGAELSEDVKEHIKSVMEVFTLDRERSKTSTEDADPDAVPVVPEMTREMVQEKVRKQLVGILSEEKFSDIWGIYVYADGIDYTADYQAKAQEFHNRMMEVLKDTPNIKLIISLEDLMAFRLDRRSTSFILWTRDKLASVDPGESCVKRSSCKRDGSKFVRSTAFPVEILSLPLLDTETGKIISDFDYRYTQG